MYRGKAVFVKYCTSVYILRSIFCLETVLLVYIPISTPYWPVYLIIPVLLKNKSFKVGYTDFFVLEKILAITCT